MGKHGLVKRYNAWHDLAETIGDGCIMLLGGLLVYIFITIEVLGVYGVEPNKIIRDLEKYAGFPILALGLWRLIDDLIAIRRKK